MRTAYCLTLVLLSPVAQATAQEIIGQEKLTGALRSVDPKTGEATFIGMPPLGGGILWDALAFDSQGVLYTANGDWNYGWDIFTIDPNTAQTTLVTHVDINSITCMAFDDNDTLFFMNDRAYPLVQGEYDLYTLDLATGAPTLVGALGTTSQVLAMDFHDGILYAHPGGIGLSTVDQNTGHMTDIEPAHIGIIGSLSSSMAFNEQGTLYYLDSFLWTLDPETTTSSIIDWVPPFPIWGECVFREGPTPNIALTLSGFSGGPMKVKVTGATPFGQVAILAAFGSGGPTTIPAGFPCAGVDLQLNSSMRLIGIGTTDLDGYLELGPDTMPSAARTELRIQAIDLTSCEVTNKAIVTF